MLKKLTLLDNIRIFYRPQQKKLC